MTFTVDLNWKNGLPLVAGVSVVLLAIIPLNVEPTHLAWMRWQVSIYALMGVAVVSLFGQALILSKEDRERDQRDRSRDQRQNNIESQLAELNRQLRAGAPKLAITENPVKLEAPPTPPPAQQSQPDIDGEVHRLAMSPRSASWPIVKDVFRLQGRPEEAVVDTDILIDMYLVNQNLTSTQYIKALRLSAEVDGVQVNFEYQHDLLAEPFADHNFEYALEVEGEEEPQPLKQLFDRLPAALEPQQPAEGWVRFMAKGINADKVTDGTVILTVVNSLGKEFVISRASTDRPRNGEIALRRVG